MRKFQFLRPDVPENRALNWENLNQNVDCREYDPFEFADPTNEDFTNVDTYWGVYSVSGSIVTFSISLTGTGMTWINGSVLRLPIAIALRANGVPQQYGLSFPVQTEDGFRDDGFGHSICFGTNLSTELFAGQAESVGVNQFNISGWYFR